MMSPSDISTCRLLFHRSQDMSYPTCRDSQDIYLSIVIPSESGYVS